MKAFLVSCLLLALPAMAANIDRRIARQEMRIGYGVQTGALTYGEAARLQMREQRMRRVIARDRWDGGGLSRHERAKIQRMENRTSRAITRQSNDWQYRY